MPVEAVRSYGQCNHHKENTNSVPFGTCFGCESPEYDGELEMWLTKRRASVDRSEGDTLCCG